MVGQLILQSADWNHIEFPFAGEKPAAYKCLVAWLFQPPAHNFTMSQITLSNHLKKELKARARQLEPLVKIGKGGLSDKVVAETARLFDRKDLVKVRFVDFKDEKKPMSEKLAEATSSVVIQVVGNVSILYRPLSPSTPAS